MSDQPKRILAFVPNGASTDNRVVREAESLKRAGHEVLLVGLRLADLPGRRAFSAGGVNIARIDWQYRAFSKIALVYALIILPVFLAFMAILAVGLTTAYFGLLLPLAETLFDSISAFVLYIARGVAALVGWPQAAEFTAPTATELNETSPLWYHLFSLAILFLLFRVLRRPLQRVSRGLVGPGFNRLVRPFFTLVLQKVKFAQNYGKRENVQSFTFLETLLASDNSLIGQLHERISHHFVDRERGKAFIEIGRDFKPDLIQCHEIGPLPSAIALKDELGCKVLYEAHEIYDSLANASSVMSKRHRRIHETCLPKVDAFITVNNHLGNYYTETYPSIPQPVILPNSVYPKSVVYDGRLHEAAGLPREAKILLYQGGFSFHRGMQILMEAAYKLPEDWYVVFMGKGPLEKVLKAESKKLHAAAVETFTDEKVLQYVAEIDPLQPEQLTTDAAAVEGGLEQTATALHRLQEVELRRSVKAQVTAKGTLKKARFVPIAPHSELVEWTSGGTIGVIPYENIGLNHWNCSPNKIWEYPNAGLPLLASRLSYLTYIINKWNIGWTISSDPKPMDIVSAIRSIEANGDLEEKRQACADFIAQDNYTLHEQRLLDLVDSLL